MNAIRWMFIIMLGVGHGGFSFLGIPRTSRRGREPVRARIRSIGGTTTTGGMGLRVVDIRRIFAVAGCIFLAMSGLVAGATFLWDTLEEWAVWEDEDNWTNIGCYFSPCYGSSV